MSIGKSEAAKLNNFSDRTNRVSHHWDKPKWHDREPWMGLKVIAVFILFALSLLWLLYLVCKY